LSEAVSSLFDAQPANANAAKIAAAPKVRLRSRASIVIGSVASHPARVLAAYGISSSAIATRIAPHRPIRKA